MTALSTPLTRFHRTRLMQIWRSAGWPCKDGLEIELHDKHAALKTLAAQAGMVTDNTKTATEVSVKQAPTVNVVIEKA